MFRLYTATIRPYLKNRSISFFSTFGIPTVYIDGVVVTYAILFFTLRLKTRFKIVFNPLNAELSPICNLLALIGAHHILHINRIRVKTNVYIKYLKWAGHVARMGEDRGVERVLVGKPEGKRPLGRPRRRWEDNIKMDLQEVGGGRGDWMELAQERRRWRALVGMVRDFRVP